MAFFGFGKKQPVILSDKTPELWAEQLAAHHDITKDYALFAKNLDKATKEFLEKTSNLLLEKGFETVPERAQHISLQHAKAISDHATKLSNTIAFTDILSFPQELQKSLDATAYFREHTTKNISALREYFMPQLNELTESLQALEDTLIKSGESIDQKLEPILALSRLATQIESAKGKKRKFEKTLNKYVEERNMIRTREKKHLLRIEEQQKLVRDKAALGALEKIKELERGIHSIQERYARLLFDTKHYLLKNSLTLNENSKQLFESLKRDPKNIIVKSHEKLKREFIELHQTLETLEAQDNKNVLSRLEKAAHDIADDAHKIQSDEPHLHELKKLVMHDIAALNIYEQEQFLLKVYEDAAEINEKIDVLTDALEELDYEPLVLELEKNITALDAVLRHEKNLEAQ